MARKKLLTESEIRRFMKLANVAPVGNKRLSEMYDAPGMRDEEEEEPAMRDMMEQEEEEMDMEMDMEEPMGDELPAEMPEEPMGDEEMDMGMGAEGDMISISDFMSALEKALEDTTGQEVSSEIGMDDEMEAPPEGGDADLSAEMPPMDDEEMDMEMGDEEDMLAERIARRVRARLRVERKAADALKESKMRKVKAKMKRERMANDLTERIFTRLTTK